MKIRKLKQIKKSDSPFTIVAKLFFICKNSYFVKDEKKKNTLNQLPNKVNYTPKKYHACLDWIVTAEFYLHR